MGNVGKKKKQELNSPLPKTEKKKSSPPPSLPNYSQTHVAQLKF